MSALLRFQGVGGVFVMGMINSWFTPERTRALLAGRPEGVANAMAAGLGIVTPRPRKYGATANSSR